MAVIEGTILLLLLFAAPMSGGIVGMLFMLLFWGSSQPYSSLVILSVDQSGRR